MTFGKVFYVNKQIMTRILELDLVLTLIEGTAQ